jgi:hypothetical protein
VNGVPYDTTRASVWVDGRAAHASDLRVGDVVLVLGRLNHGGTAGTADRIHVSSVVRGPIEAIDTARGSLVVLGQRVATDADTAYDDSVPQRALAGLRAGDAVDVAGFRASDGEVRATRVAMQAFDAREFATSGVATAMDTVVSRFALDGLVVDYGGAMIESFPDGTVDEGDRVEVYGSSIQRSGELVASKVAFDRGSLATEAGARVELEGYVTDYDVRLPVTFSLAGVVVTTTPQTVWEGGNFIGSGREIKVEVEGTVAANGLVVGNKIRFARPSPLRISASVDSVDASASSFVALGIAIRTDALTRIEDRSSARQTPFSVAHLSPGDYVRVTGLEVPASGGAVVASLIERHDPQTVTELQGYVNTTGHSLLSFRGPVFILGVASTGTPTTRYRFGSGDIGALTFFFDLTIGALVRVRGVEVADREIVASEVAYVN